MSSDIVRESLRRITVWGVGHRSNQAKRVATKLIRRDARWHQL